MSKNGSHTEIFEFGEEGDAFDIAGAEKSLLVAILQTAAADLTRGNHLSQRAVEFFLSSEEDYVFSFRSICEYLKVEHTHVLRVVGLLPRAVAGQDNSVWNDSGELEVAFERLRNRL